MNFLARTVAAALTAFGVMAGTASAAPVINFDVADASGGSSVYASGFHGWISPGTIEANLVSDLGSQVFSLAEGESKTFDFFTLTSDGGFGSFNVAAKLAFDKPADAGAADATGSGWALVVSGLFDASLGKFFWDYGVLPDFLTTINGSVFSVDFSDGFQFAASDSATIQATVTAVSVVPVPAALVLMLSGLFGLGALGRFRSNRATSAA